MKASEDELRYADAVGRFFVRRYGLPPVTGRVLGWLLICEPPDQTAAQVAEALQISRSAVGAAVTTLEHWSLVRRHRPVGERADRIVINPLADASVERRARLLGLKAFSDFLVERMPQLRDEWRERARALRESGELP